MIELKVYDEDGNIVKTVKGEPVHFRFGTIRKLMRLVEVENAKDTGDLLKIVGGAWGEITRILTRCFPGMTEDDWDGVEINELLPAVIEIVKDAVTEINMIPGSDEKKPTAV
jgi:nitrogen regulatory protein PII-like uncharacterized protein